MKNKYSIITRLFCCLQRLNQSFATIPVYHSRFEKSIFLILVFFASLSANAQQGDTDFASPNAAQLTKKNINNLPSYRMMSSAIDDCCDNDFSMEWDVEADPNSSLNFDFTNVGTSTTDLNLTTSFNNVAVYNDAPIFSSSSAGPSLLLGMDGDDSSDSSQNMVSEMTFSDEVYLGTIVIYDIERSNNWQDQVLLEAFDANNNAVTVNVSLGANLSTTVDGYVTDASGTANISASNVDHMATYTFPDAVKSIKITYRLGDGGGTSDPTGQLILISNFDFCEIVDTDNDGLCNADDPDDDNDGVNDNTDCAPLDPAIFPGASCDDGNAATFNDVYDASCICAGSLCTVTNDLLITGVIDGPLSGGTPKAIELYVVNNIADLSLYGLGSANNGGGSDGQEFTFPSVSATAGQFIYIASETSQFNTFFGFDPDYTTSAASINGDDAIELFQCSQVIDVFGLIDTDGTGTSWEYKDGWAYRNCGTGPDGNTFVEASWSFSGVDALDNETSNASAASPFPIGTFSPVCPLLGCTDPGACNFDVSANVDDGSCLIPVADCSQCNGMVLESIDNDNDGICNADDPDDDNDGVDDTADCAPFNASIFPGGPCDDGDACTAPDVYDASCNCTSTALPDFDNDGICDDQDPDDDNDGIDDTADCAPFDASIFPGGPCDDGDACTAPDVYDASCNCTSTALPDFDNDGICDDQDPDDDNDGVDDTADCAPFNASIFPGGPCDDGDACTAPDVYDASCNCTSTALPDFDNDGICDDQDPDDDNDGVDDTADCAPFDASIFPGGPCDDGDACTAPDVYDASCNCTSTALPDFDNDGICDDQDPDDDNDGVDDTADCAPFDASIFPGGPCDDGDACTAPDVYDASCNCTSTALPDFDNDGICDDQDPDDDNDGVDDTADCAPFDASIFPGGPCDDGRCLHCSGCLRCFV